MIFFGKHLSRFGLINLYLLIILRYLSGDFKKGVHTKKDIYNI